jgi:hypothetical protein
MHVHRGARPTWVGEKQFPSSSPSIAPGPEDAAATEIISATAPRREIAIQSLASYIACNPQRWREGAANAATARARELSGPSRLQVSPCVAPPRPVVLSGLPAVINSAIWDPKSEIWAGRHIP